MSRLPWIVTLPCTQPLMVVLGETSALQRWRNFFQSEKTREEHRGSAPELAFIDSGWTFGKPQHAKRVHEKRVQHRELCCGVC